MGTKKSTYSQIGLFFVLLVLLLSTPLIITATPNDTSIVVVSSTLEPIADSIITDQETIVADTTIKNKVENATERKNKPTLREELMQAPDVKKVISFGKIFWSIVFIAIGYFILRAIGGVLSLFAERKPRYKPLIFRTLPILKILGWSFIVYIIISGVFQPPRETVFAFFASVGVAIGFAAQDLIKNIFGGLMIMFDKPFQIGDKIESGKYYGEVLEVGLRSTRIVTADDSVVTIPNSEMMNQSISNSNSSENNCQVVAELFLPQTIDTQLVREIATEVAQVSKYIYLNKPIAVVFFSELTNNKVYLRMRLKAYVMDIRHEFAFKSEMTELVLRELQKEGLISE